MAVVDFVLAALCIVWFLQAGLVFKHLAEIRTLTELPVTEPITWPRVSTIVPARDEAASIGTALQTRLDDDYPDLELIVVDDRSTDDTPAIVAGIAARDPRVVALRVNELPEGWLGKLNALEQGTHAVTGEWLLISDADIHLEPGTLRRAVAFCESSGCDFIALVPEFRSRSFAVNVLWSTFVRILIMAFSPAAIRNPNSKAGMGSGSFMLMRKSAYDTTPGFEHIRMETGDDVALGVMLKQSGARCEFMNGRGAAWLPSYGNMREFLRGIEKNGATFASTPFPLFAAGTLFAGLLEYSPLIALALGVVSGTPWLALLGGVATVVATAANVASLHVGTRTYVPALLWPVGWLGMATGVLRSVWLAHRRGGVEWRGTFYPTDELVRGQRFKPL